MTEINDTEAAAAWQDATGEPTMPGQVYAGEEDWRPKYPDIEVQLTGEDGNAFAILGTVQRELRRAGVDQAEVSAFFAEATAGDYDHLLATVQRWVEVA